MKFLPLIKTFYENIKINATIFLIRFDIDVFDPEPVLGKGMIQTEDDNKKKEQIEWLVDSRKLLHIIMNEQEMKQKPLVVVINVKFMAEKILFFLKNQCTKKEEEIINDIKEFIEFDKILTPHKDIILSEFNRFDFDPVWQRVIKLIMETPKEKEN